MKTILFYSVFMMMATAQAFSVGTQNLYHYNKAFDQRLAHLKNEIQSPGLPQVVGLQEAAQWTLRESLYGQLMELTHYQGIYQSTNQYGVMNEGLALVGSLPATQLESLELPATKMFSRQYLNSGFFQTPRGLVLIVNIHMSPFGENKDRRLEQSQFILQHVQQKAAGHPVILVGDFNDAYNSPTLAVFKAQGFKDVLDGQGYTFNPDTNPLVTDKQFGPSRLDYILYRPSELTLQSARLMCVENWVSDHYGLRAEFQ